MDNAVDLLLPNERYSYKCCSILLPWLFHLLFSAILNVEYIAVGRALYGNSPPWRGEERRLLIEVALISVEFVLAFHAAFPPGFNETAAITDELNEGRCHTKQTNLGIVVF